MKSVRTSVQPPSSVRRWAMQALRRTPSLMRPIFWATCWAAVLVAWVGGGVGGGGAQVDALEPLAADEPPGGGQGGLGGVALAAGPGGDDVGEFGGADVPVGPGEADDADQALGEELGDGEVQAPA